MSGFSLWWIDGKLLPGAFLREAAGRFFLLLLLGAYFAAMLLSGGMNRYLSERWAVTAVLRPSVTDVEGEGIAKKAAGLPGVRSAVYKDPEASWKEFLEAYPGLETLRTAGGTPLPGYVEIRMRPDRFAEADLRAMESVLAALPEVEKILSGGEILKGLLRVNLWVNALFRAGFGILAAVTFMLFFLQEKGRATALSGDFDFLRDRGIPSRRIALSRAAGAALAAGILSLAATAASVSVLFLLEARLPLLRRVIGSAGEILTLPFLVPLALFLLAAAAFSGGASLLGWRAAQSRRK